MTRIAHGKAPVSGTRIFLTDIVRRWRHAVGGMLCVLLLTACGAKQTAPDKLTLNAPFPSITMTRFEGGAASLQNYRGKWLVLNLWATWCPPCRKELPSLQRLSERLDPARFAVVGLALEDDAHLVREYLIDKGITYPNFLDPGLGIGTGTLGVTAYPFTYVISPEGVLLGRAAGEREWDRPEMLRRLNDAAGGRPAALAGM